MKALNTKKPPTEPGNDMGLFLGSSLKGGCKAENPRLEKIGKRMAALCLFMAYTWHGVLFPTVLIVNWVHGEQDWLAIALSTSFGALLILGMLLAVLRFFANALTRKEDHRGYKALTVHFVCGLAEVLLLIVLSIVMSY